MSKVTKIF